jgi:tRNA G18 (ribose-2'-O)-methylase SpoU
MMVNALLYLVILIMWSINLSAIPKISIRFFSTSKLLSFDYLYGINPVECALHANRRSFESLYLSDSEHIELSSRAAKLMHFAKATALPIIFTHKDKLTRMVKQQPHQNIVLKCSPLLLPSAATVPQFQPGTYVFCDKITDPQNFGAILRSCLFFGVQAVFTGKKNHCPLNPTVSKASAGAAELIPTYLV